MHPAVVIAVQAKKARHVARKRANKRHQRVREKVIRAHGIHPQAVRQLKTGR